MNGDQTIGQVMLWALPWAPAGWHLCDGTLLNITQNQALYSILGTTYGGDGKTTFGLPDFRGRIPVGQGQDPNFGIVYPWGGKGGTETVTLDVTNLPQHTHTVNLTPQYLSFKGALQVANSNASTPTPSASTYLAGGFSPTTDPNTATNYEVLNFISAADAHTSVLANTVNVTTTPTALSATVSNMGGSLPHNNMQPYLAMSYIIATQGYYPQRP